MRHSSTHFPNAAGRDLVARARCLPALRHANAVRGQWMGAGRTMNRRVSNRSVIGMTHLREPDKVRWR